MNISNELSYDARKRLVEILTKFGRIETVQGRLAFLEAAELDALKSLLPLQEDAITFAYALVRESRLKGVLNQQEKSAFSSLLEHLQELVAGQIDEYNFVASLWQVKNPLVYTTLEVPSRDFTGRTKEIEHAVNSLHSGRPVIISGMGGIGKSDLARKVAQIVQPHFPGPHLQIELQPDNNPVAPIALLGTLLLALNSNTRLPDTLKERLALLQPLLQGRRGILFLDNAIERQQVKPLEPIWQEWAVLITSRASLIIQGSRLVKLESLEAESAIELVMNLTEGYGRTLSTQEATDIARECHYHPLAMHVASAYLSTLTHNPVIDYLSKVRRTPLQALSIPEYGNIAQVLAVSIAQIYEGDPVICSRWHLLALMPDAFDVEIASALLGQIETVNAPVVTPLDTDTTKLTLDTLCRLNLIQPLNEVQGTVQYRLHDFLIDYALNYSPYIPSENERFNAVRCHALSVLEWGSRANDLYKAGHPTEALIRFDALWSHIDAAWHRLNKSEDYYAYYFVNKFTDLMSLLLNVRISSYKRTAYREAALPLTRLFNDYQSEIWHLENLGNEYAKLDDHLKAVTYYEQALSISTSKQHSISSADQYSRLGLTYWNLGDVRGAISYYEHALAVSRNIVDKHSESASLSNLGNAYATLGESDTAIMCYDQSLSISREIGDKYGELGNLGKLGVEHQNEGNSEIAIRYYKEAVVVAREIDDKRSESRYLGRLGIIYTHLGESSIGIDYNKHALTVARNIGDKLSEGNHLGNLGLAYVMLGDVESAIGYYEQAVIIADELDDKRVKALYRWNIALAYEQQDQRVKAIEYGKIALSLFVDIGARYIGQVRAQLREWGVEA